MPRTEKENQLTTSTLNKIFMEYEARIQKDFLSKYIFPPSLDINTLFTPLKVTNSDLPLNTSFKGLGLGKSFNEISSKKIKNKMSAKLIRTYQ